MTTDSTPAASHVDAIVTRLRKWWLRVFPRYERLDTGWFTYRDADRLLRESAGQDVFWRLDPKEDGNLTLGWVWIEKVKRVSV